MRTWLRNLRTENGLSQQDVALRLGITQQHYSLIEQGERQSDMSISVARKLADAFDVSLEKILEMESVGTGKGPGMHG